MNKNALLRDLRNAALTFQQRTVETMLRHNPHSPEAIVTDHVWTGWGRPGKCTPIPGEALAIFECLHCERLITPESDPEMDCPKARKRPVSPKDEPEQGNTQATVTPTPPQPPG